MAKSPSRDRKTEGYDLCLRAEEQWERGELRSAFRRYLKAAKGPDRDSQVNVGYFYDKGIGVAPNRDAAMYWYKRAYRRGISYAASNIGTIWRDEGQSKRAIYWFQKAVELGEDGANLEIAKYYLKDDPTNAIKLLTKVCESNRVCGDEREEAKRMLKRAEREIAKREK